MFKFWPWDFFGWPLSAIFATLQAQIPSIGWDWRTVFAMPVCFFSVVVLYLYGVLIPMIRISW